jgi:spermidine/putrescine transport system substrate-binding protein
MRRSSACSPGFRSDVTHICAGSVPRWQASGIIEPWDRARITAYDTLNADLVGQDVLAGSAELFFLPTDYGSTALVYNSDEVPAEDVASLEIFNNPAYAGRLSIPDNVDDAYALAYLATGVTDWSMSPTSSSRPRPNGCAAFTPTS